MARHGHYWIGKSTTICRDCGVSAPGGPVCSEELVSPEVVAERDALLQQIADLKAELDRRRVKR